MMLQTLLFEETSILLDCKGETWLYSVINIIFCSRYMDCRLKLDVFDMPVLEHNYIANK